MRQKKIFVIAGLPATGKSSLANVLAGRIDAPCFGKDVLKEIVFKTFVPENRSESRRIGIACEELLLEQALCVIEHVPFVVIESTFQPAFLKEFSEIARSRAIELVVVLCVTDRAVLLERYVARIPYRDPRHFDHPNIVVDAPDLDVHAWDEIAQVHVFDTTSMAADDLPAKVDALLKAIL